MAKISINKLKLNKDYKKINIKWNEETDIEVKQYLPVNEKLELISSSSLTSILLLRLYISNLPYIKYLDLFFS